MNENNLPLVSIWCPTYNHENYISQCLDGFVMQKTNFKFEIIVHDDASTDNTANIVKDYETKYPHLFRCKYQLENQFSKDCSHLTRTMLNECKSKYIALCEGDDYWTDPYKLQKQVDFLEANKDYAICFHNVQVIDNVGVFKRYSNNITIEQTYTIEDLAKGNFIFTTSCIFRNNIHKIPDWFHKVSVGDYPLALINAQYGKIKYFPNLMGSYRIHSDGIWSQKHDALRRLDWISLLVVLSDKFSLEVNTILKEQLQASIHFEYEVIQEIIQENKIINNQIVIFRSKLLIRKIILNLKQLIKTIFL